MLESIWTHDSRADGAARPPVPRGPRARRSAGTDIELVRWADLDKEEQKYCKRLFRDRVFPVLTPLAVDPAHPFPYISGLSLNLAVLVRNPKTDKEHFARVKVPPIFSRFVPLGNQRFVPLEDVIGEHLKRLFPGMEVLEVHTFRVTRNEDLDVEEDDAENLLAALEKELLRRRFGPPVRLEVEESISPAVLELLVSELGISDGRGVPARRPARPERVARHRRPRPRGPALPDLHPGDPHRTSREVESAAPVDVFKATQRQRRSPPPPLRLVRHQRAAVHRAGRGRPARAGDQADALPDVAVTRPIIDALVDAAEAGKQVLVIVEIKARFDEQANIRWARQLEQAGCHVVYGLVGLKTHCKLAMVVRDEPEGIRRYIHIGTGNYNSKTARLYEDIGLITTDERIGEDVAHLFNNLSGYSRNAVVRRSCWSRPTRCASGLLDQIHREIAHHRAGRPARIRIKANSVVDEAMIDALYLASQDGVPIELLIRGICSLRPGVPGLSETIEVRSVLGRFLEHSRVFWFENGGEPDAWIGSADLMHRNLDRRVEVLVRLPASETSREIDHLLDVAFDEDTGGLAARTRTGSGTATTARRTSRPDADRAPATEAERPLTCVVGATDPLACSAVLSSSPGVTRAFEVPAGRQHVLRPLQ